LFPASNDSSIEAFFSEDRVWAKTLSLIPYIADYHARQRALFAALSFFPDCRAASQQLLLSNRQWVVARQVGGGDVDRRDLQILSLSTLKPLPRALLRSGKEPTKDQGLPRGVAVAEEARVSSGDTV
jgi:hypothetical protein